MTSEEQANARVPLASLADDRGYKNGKATSTCFCGAVQLSFPTTAPGLENTFICHCSDDHKIHASMFASNFVVLDSHLTFIRGKENLKQFKQSHTIASGNSMENNFCSTCGVLMYRVSSGYPGKTIMRIGPVDDLSLLDGPLRPQVEQWTEHKAPWLKPVDGTKSSERVFDGLLDNPFPRS